jgi:hypothetical protein
VAFVSTANSFFDDYSDGTFQCGDVVIVRHYNSIENPEARGKPRPAVLVRQQPKPQAWLVMGLTTKPQHLDGTPRVPVPNPTILGLSGPGFLWGGRLTVIDSPDILRRIGRVDGPMAEAIIGLVGLGGEDRLELRRAAEAADRRGP